MEWHNTSARAVKLTRQERDLERAMERTRTKLSHTTDLVNAERYKTKLSRQQAHMDGIRRKLDSPISAIEGGPVFETLTA